RDSEEFEKALDDLPAEGEGEKEVHVHVHMPEAKEAGVTDEEINPEDDPDRKLSEVLSKLDARLTALEEAVKSIGATKDEESVEKKEEKATNDDDPDGQDPFMDSELGTEEEKSEVTKDSVPLRLEFQQVKAKAEILAPGLKQPTFDAKALANRTKDSICVMRRRALRAAMAGPNAELVSKVIANHDIGKVTCDAASALFDAAAAIVADHNNRSNKNPAKDQGIKSGFADINTRNAEFW
ncbi:hypothetical protein, partial [Chromobacterium haemolyticum]|uniref:hypothetical protein n=1 Tax=Chromobacterium haemolyticum TaxID=394935 RepID=UPI001931099F